MQRYVKPQNVRLMNFKTENVVKTSVPVFLELFISGENLKPLTPPSTDLSVTPFSNDLDFVKNLKCSEDSQCLLRHFYKNLVKFGKLLKPCFSRYKYNIHIHLDLSLILHLY